jgi:hypothetical protein
MRLSINFFACDSILELYNFSFVYILVLVLSLFVGVGVGVGVIGAVGRRRGSRRTAVLAMRKMPRPRLE